MQFIINKDPMQSTHKKMNTNSKEQRENRQLKSQYNANYSIYNASRYPMAQGSSKFISKVENGQRMKSNTKQRSTSGFVGVNNLSRVQSAYNLSRDVRNEAERDYQGNGKLAYRQQTIVELPDLQCSSSRAYLQKSKKIQQTKVLRSSVIKETQEQLQLLKEKTIYKNKQPTRSTHEKEETYFGLFAAKNKCKIARNSEIKNVIQVKGKEEAFNCGQQNELQSMRRQYNRLRVYLQDLEEKLAKLSQKNSELVRENANLQKSLRNKVKESRQLSRIQQRQDQISHQQIGIRSGTDLSQTYVDVCELLGKAKEEILARDKLIQDLKSQLEIAVVPAKNRSLNNPISPFDIDSNHTYIDSTTHQHILSLKQYLEKANTQERLLRERVDFLEGQLNKIVNQVHFQMQRSEQQKQKLLEKEVELDLHIKYTRGIMKKLGFWQKNGIETEEEQSQAEQRVWYSRQQELPQWARQIQYASTGTAETSHLVATQNRTILPLFMRKV